MNSKEDSKDLRLRDLKREKGFFDFFSKRRQPVSEDEIKDIVADNDELLEDEKRMIHEIIELGDMTVREIMTPRVDMMLVEDTETGLSALERMRGTGYSRLPVYHDNKDGIVGIVHYKDLIGPLMDGKINEPVTRFMYEPLFVPETKDVIPLLSEMQEAHQPMAIVVDEYGGTDGLITIEDIVEEIVGEIIDETDAVTKPVVALDDSSWRADGALEVGQAQALGWPVGDSDDYETLAGWLMATLDYVPKAGDELDVGNYRFVIERMRRSRISTVRVQKLDA